MLSEILWGTECMKYCKHLIALWEQNRIPSKGGEQLKSPKAQVLLLTACVGHKERRHGARGLLR